MSKNNHKILQNYVTPSGKVPFLEWLHSLRDPVTRLRIRRRLDRKDIKTAKAYWHELKERSDE